MKNASQLAIRFREVLLNGKWIANTNYREILKDVTWSQATKRIASLNTITLLTQHINYYVSGVLNVFEGGELEIRDKYSFDFNPIASEEEWQALQNKLFSNSEKFADAVEQMSTAKLNEDFVKEAYGSYRRNVEAMIEHCYYHLGQISLIKKMILEKEDVI